MNQRRLPGKKPDLPLWVAAAVAAGNFLSLTQLAWLVPALGSLRPAFLSLSLSLLGLFIYRDRWRPQDMAQSRYWKIIALVCVVAVLGIPFAVVSMNAVNFLKDVYFKVLLQAVMVWAVCRTPRHRTLMMVSVMAAAVFSMVLAIFSINELTGRLASPVYDANSLALLANFTLPMLGWILWSGRGWWRYLVLPVAPLCLYVLITASSRGGFLSFAAMGMATVMLATPSAPRQLQKLFPITVVAGILMLPFTPQSVVDRLQSLIDGSDYNFTSDTGRVELWKRGIMYGIKSPIFGTGIFNFHAAEDLTPVAARYAEQGLGFNRNVAHSTYIEAIAELGLVAGGAFCYLILITVWDLFQRARKARQSRDPDGIFAGTLAISMTGFAVCIMFLSYTYFPTLYLFFGMAYGLFDSLEESPRTQPARAPRGRRAQRMRRYPVPQPHAPVMRRDARA